MRLDEKTIREHEVFEGRLLRVYQDEVGLPNGDTSKREIVRHPGGACILAEEDGKIVLVRQFRYAYGREILELPAGKIEKGEDPYDTAMRELREETGLVAQRLESLGTVYPSPGYTDEVIYLFLAVDPRPADGQHLDHDEFVNVERHPREKVVSMIMEGSIPDAKTQIAVLKMLQLGR